MSISDHKSYLLLQSEKIVDLQQALEEARADDDRPRCELLFDELEQIGDDLTGLQKVLSSDDLAFSRFMLGSVCALMGLWPHAETAYALALEHWPEHVGLLNEMAECQFELGNYPKAAEYLEKSQQIGGPTPVIIQELATAYAWSGDANRAKLTLISGIAKFPDEPALYQALRELDQPS